MPLFDQEARRRKLVADLCAQLFDPLGYPHPLAAVPPALFELGAFCLRCDACQNIRQIGGVLGVGEEDFDWIMKHVPRITTGNKGRRLGTAAETVAAEEEAVADNPGLLGFMRVPYFFQVLVSPDLVDQDQEIVRSSGPSLSFREAAVLLRRGQTSWFLSEWVPRCAAVKEDSEEDARLATMLREPASSLLRSAGSYLQFLAVLGRTDVLRARALWLARVSPDPTPVHPYVHLIKLGLLPFPALPGVVPRHLSLRGWRRTP